jgi:histidinol-phosphate aminotransferase
VNDYPDTSYLELRKRLSRYCAKSIDSFVITNGADEALDIITKSLLNPKDEVIIPTPTYSMFRVTTEIAGAKPVIVPRVSGFDIDVDAISKRITNRTKIVFLCSPNNPTGNLVSRLDVRNLLETKRNCTVVIDEAYFEFSGVTMSDLIKRHDNLLVVRTFSKAFSMAGVRVGYIISSIDSTRKLNIVRPPNSLSVISLFLAEKALQNLRAMRKIVSTIVNEREKMIDTMSEERKISVFPSHANFVLFQLDGLAADYLHKRLMRKGFVLRKFPNTSVIKDCLRVTISTPKVNSRFLVELKRQLAEMN